MSEAAARLHWIMPDRHAKACLQLCLQYCLPGDGIVLLGSAVRLQIDADAMQACSEYNCYASLEECGALLPPASLESTVQLVDDNALAELVLRYQLHQTWI